MTLYTNTKSFQILPDDAVRHLFSEIFNQQKYKTILQEGENVKCHTLAPFKAPQGTDCGSEAIGCPLHDQSLPFDPC
jgi:hypothetical protein